MNEPLPREIRGVMIPVSGGRLLLPNATITEVITLPTAAEVPGAPAWLLGRIAWRGWRVPLISFSAMANLAERDGAMNSRVAVLKALGGNPRMPFIAMVTQGFPRLTTLSSDIVIPTDDGTELPDVISAHVMVRDDFAVIPDLEVVELMIDEAIGETEAA